MVKSLDPTLHYNSLLNTFTHQILHQSIWFNFLLLSHALCNYMYLLNLEILQYPYLDLEGFLPLSFFFFFSFLDKPCPVNLDAYAETHVKLG